MTYVKPTRADFFEYQEKAKEKTRLIEKFDWSAPFLCETKLEIFLIKSLHERESERQVILTNSKQARRKFILIFIPFFPFVSVTLLFLSLAKIKI